MNPTVQREYMRLRRRDWPAANAMRAARIHAAFDGLDGQLVKLDVEPEIDVYDDSYLDTWAVSPRKLESLRKELRERIEREGHWILVSYFRTRPEGEWIALDSVGGFVGDDYVDSGYDTDMKEAALEALANEGGLRDRYCA